MSTYHKWRTVFIQIPKNASTTIHAKLSNKTDQNHSHKSYFDILGEEDMELIETYFSFAVSRNPYDRFISAYEHEVENGNIPLGLSFGDLIKKIGNDNSTLSHLQSFFFPQYQFVSIKSIILVDKIIRFENLNEEWKEIASIINEKNKQYNFTRISDKLDVLNANSARIGKTIDDYYTKETKEIIYNTYKKDFELFRYEK